MEGSAKQVEWATKIKSDFLQYLNLLMEFNTENTQYAKEDQNSEWLSALEKERFIIEQSKVLASSLDLAKNWIELANAGRSNEKDLYSSFRAAVLFDADDREFLVEMNKSMVKGMIEKEIRLCNGEKPY